MAPTPFTRLQTDEEREPTVDDLREIIGGEPCSDRPLSANDNLGLGRGAFIKPWIHANLGEAGAHEWKGSLIADWNTWIVPASLLMTCAFSFEHVVEEESLEARWLAHTEFAWMEEWLRVVIAHAYTLSMACSGLIALKSINDYAQKVLLAVHTPAKLLPQMLAIERHFEVIERRDGGPPWTRRVLHYVGVKSGAGAYRQSIGLLGVGLTCSALLRSGPSYALLIAIPFYIIISEMYYEGYTAFTGPLDRAGKSLEAAAKPRTAEEPGQRSKE